MKRKTPLELGGYADLHIHTTASDGTLPPRTAVKNALRCGLRAIAITDHDAIGGIEEALKYGFNYGIEVIPGIELSTEILGAEVHILGYFIDHEDAELEDRLKKLRTERKERARKIIHKLDRLGLEVGFDRVMELAGAGSVGRPHIARVIAEQGYTESIGEAFDKYIGDGRPAYVKKYKLTPAEAIDMIHHTGGVTSLAHPFVLGRDGLIPKLVGDGLDGIEVYHSQQNKEVSDYYEKIARKHDLLITGGSDCHGTAKEEALMGKVIVPYSLVEKMKDKLKGELKGLAGGKKEK